VLCFGSGDLFPDHPKATARMVSVARRTLLERGVDNPADHVMVIDSGTLLSEIVIRESEFSPAEVQSVLRLAASLDFTPRLMPGGVGKPPFVKIASAEGEERETLLSGLAHDLSATTDDRPFFFAFHRWGDLWGEILTPAHTTALGQIVLLLLVGTLTVLAGVFILGPLAFLRKRTTAPMSVRAGLLAYFSCIGLGFMMFEISLMQRFVLFLGYPTYSLSITLSSLLVSLGIGSHLSSRWIGREQRALIGGVSGLVLLAAFYSFALPPIQNGLLFAPLWVRGIVTSLFLFPLGLVAGVFFPLGIRCAARVYEPFIPWAWAINGCASVTGTVLSIILAMVLGFQAVWGISVLVYAVGVGALLTLGVIPASRSAELAAGRAASAASG
jgi:hypothetical protein